MQSEVRLVVVQLKREANLSVVIGFNTMHVLCRGISMLYPIFLQRVTILSILFFFFLFFFINLFLPTVFLNL